MRPSNITTVYHVYAFGQNPSVTVQCCTSSQPININLLRVVMSSTDFHLIDYRIGYWVTTAEDSFHTTRRHADARATISSRRGGDAGSICYYAVESLNTYKNQLCVNRKYIEMESADFFM